MPVSLLMGWSEMISEAPVHSRSAMNCRVSSGMVMRSSAPAAVSTGPWGAASTALARRDLGRSSSSSSSSRARAGLAAGKVTVSQRKPEIHPLVASGYAAYLAGDLPKARNDYQQVLREEPGNRDALLGLAGVEMRAQRYDLANAHYQRVLQMDPRDAHAQAGAVAILFWTSAKLLVTTTAEQLRPGALVALGALVAVWSGLPPVVILLAAAAAGAFVLGEQT